MLKSDLLEIIANGENSGVEFKRDDIRPEQLAKEIVAFANVQGGRILLGVEDNGRITGLHRTEPQEWVLNVFRDKVHPQIIPFYEEVVVEQGVRVGVITIAPGISKPYVVGCSMSKYFRFRERRCPTLIWTDWTTIFGQSSKIPKCPAPVLNGQSAFWDWGLWRKTAWGARYVRLPV